METREVPYGAINIEHKMLQLRQSQCADETTERKRKEINKIKQKLRKAAPLRDTRINIILETRYVLRSVPVLSN